jgi:gliding motility associated protien GldN
MNLNKRNNMKRYLTSSIFVALVLALFSSGDIQAQTKKKKAVPKKITAAANETADIQVLDAAAQKALADTIKPAPVAPPKDPFAFDSTRVSLRPDAAIERSLVKSRTPLPYEHIREDDAWYRERVWREIDIKEKMNLPFRFKAEDDNGNQRFINILLRSIRKGDVTAFDPNVDDRFTTPMTIARVGEIISGRCDSVQVIDWAKDPTGSKGIYRDSLVCREFNPDDITKFRIKEDWIFDKESSRMFARIIGIAPIKTYVDDAGTVLGESPIFWIYYPDLRPILALYEVYNPKNFGARMSWEELFESRYFSSYIVKSSIENPYDLFIKQYIKDDILKLLEGDNIKSKIFNFELDLWSY